MNEFLGEINKREFLRKFNIEKSIEGTEAFEMNQDIMKGVDQDEILEKARTGYYKDNAYNRKLGRVGNPYGGKKGTEEKKEEEEFKIGDKVKLEDGFDKQGKPIIREYTISKPGLRRSGEHLKEGEYYLTSPGTIGFDVTKKWLTENKISDSSKPQSDDKGKSETKDEHVISFKNPDGSVGERTIRIGNVSESKAIEWAKEHIKGTDFKSKKFHRRQRKV